MKKLCYTIAILILGLLLILVCLLKSCQSEREGRKANAVEVAAGSGGAYIKWVDFNVT